MFADWMPAPLLSPKGLLRRARAKQDVGDLAQALMAADRCLERLKGDWAPRGARKVLLEQAHLCRGEILLRLGRVQEAAEALLSGIGWLAAAPETWSRLVEELLAQGD